MDQFVQIESGTNSVLLYCTEVLFIGGGACLFRGVAMQGQDRSQSTVLLYCTVPSQFHYCTASVQYGTLQYRTVQYYERHLRRSIILEYCTAQYSTVQYSTATGPGLQHQS
jgi:hypothetical protein